MPDELILVDRVRKDHGFDLAQRAVYILAGEPIEIAKRRQFHRITRAPRRSNSKAKKPVAEPTSSTVMPRISSGTETTR